MRKFRVNLPNRCYHLIVTADNREAFGGVRRSRAESRRPSRVAHRAFFLDDGERTRLVDLVRRVSRFSGVKLLAYGVMANHFASREYFTKAYLRPLTEAGLIARTDPDHPNSPRQKYALTKAGAERIRRVAPL